MDADLEDGFIVYGTQSDEGEGAGAVAGAETQTPLSEDQMDVYR